MRIIHTHIYTCLLVFAALLCSSCQQDEAEEMATDKQIVVLYSPTGLGDNGYNDLIVKGVQTVYKTRQDAQMELIAPKSMDDAEAVIDRWLSATDSGAKQLLVLASADYYALAREKFAHGNYCNTQREVLLFESPNEDHLPIITFNAEMYGASYLAGAMVAEAGMEHALALLSNPADAVIRRAGDGFMDGYAAVSGKKADISYMHDDWHGYVMSQEAYEMMPELSAKYDFIFPVAGGTSKGIFRYLREHPEGPMTAGMDVDQSIYSSQVVGSVVKRIDRLVEYYLNAWIDGSALPQERNYGLESGYMDWQLAPSYLPSFGPLVEKHRTTAILKEKEYAE
ncbi:MAG: BMP family ABC transporter substrate-binding protein [Prevotellaceae bacterium]|nr:BMP family ABC transporter substrate-binding protein [Candidatus Minthosoma equi]